MWQEGNILLVEGKLRLRDDRVQLNCDNVQRYQPEAARSEEVVSPEPDKVPLPAAETPPDIAPSQNRRLVISITQTSDESSDIVRLRKLIDAIRDFSGQDEVTLCIKIDDRVDNLRLPTTNYCPELHQQLVELVGEEGLRLEPTT